MIRSRVRLLLLLIAAFAVIGSAPSVAQQPAKPAEKGKLTQHNPVPLNVAIVDIDGVIAHSSARKSIHDQIEVYRKKAQDEISKVEENLRKAEQELQRKSSLLQPKDLEAERRKFNEQYADYQRLAQKRKAEFQKVFGQAENKVRHAFVQVVEQVANERNLTLVIRKQQVVIAANALDISSEVLKRLDKLLPSVKVANPDTGN